MACSEGARSATLGLSGASASVACFPKRLQFPDAVADQQRSFCSVLETSICVITPAPDGLDSSHRIIRGLGFLNPEAFKMILEILGIIFLMQCANIFAQMMGRRNDVLHYVSRSDTERQKKRSRVWSTSPNTGVGKDLDQAQLR
jgi:hypothetical protein